MTVKRTRAPARARRAKAGVEPSPAGAGSPSHYVLRLYVAGMRPSSARAIANIQEICAEYLDGRFELQVIDLYQQPLLAKGDQIVALPTLIKRLPPPLRRIIGDLSDRERVLVGLDLRPRS